MQCDCEDEKCNHVAGKCDRSAAIKVYFFGLTENLCNECNEKINLFDRLAGDYRVLRHLAARV